MIARFREFPVNNPYVIAAVALLLRLFYVAIRVVRMRAWGINITEFGEEMGWVARSIATGHGFSNPFPTPTGPTAWFTPVVPYFEAGIMKLLGTSGYVPFVTLLILNALISAAICLPLYWVSERMEVSPRLASWMWALNPIAIFMCVDSVWYSIPSALLCALIVWDTFEVDYSNRASDWISYGLLWGLQIMTNAVFFIVAPFTLMWLAAKRRYDLPLLAGAMILLACVPWTVRNYLTFHTFVPLRSNLGLELWRYNGAGPRPHPSLSAQERAVYVKLGETQYMREKSNLAVIEVTENPYRFIVTSAKRFADMWLAEDYPPTIAIHGELTLKFRYIAQWVFVTLGFLGLIRCYKVRQDSFWLLAPFIVVFPAIYYLTIVGDLYRHPIDPILTLLAALAFA